MRAPLALLFACALPAVSGLAVLPSLCRLRAGVRHFQHTFEFPLVPFAEGVRRIHAPGLLQARHALGVHNFEILHVSAPATLDNNVTRVDLKCRAMGFTPVRTVRLFSRHPTVSNVVLTGGGGRPYLVATLRALPAGEGHRLRVDVAALTGAARVVDMLLPLSVGVGGGWEARTDEHPRLAEYRARVLARGSP